MTAKSSRRNWLARATAAPTLLALLLFAVALMGGSSRGDTASVILLRPLALALAVVGIARVDADARHRLAAQLAIALGVVVLVVFHVVPLPPAIWSALPGRDIVIEIDRAARLGAVWRPLTLDPWSGYNTLFALAVPVAALTLAAPLDLPARRRILAIVIGIGLLSAVLGVLQFAAGPSSPFYFYRISSNGSAVGLLANRNHQGVFLGALFPLIAAYAASTFARDPRRRHDGRASGDPRRWGAAVVAAMLLPVVFATSSRAGVASAAIGISGAMLIAWPYFLVAIRTAVPGAARAQSIASRPWFRGVLITLGGAGFIAFAVFAVGLSSGNGVDRMLADSHADTELRWPVWQVTWAAVHQFFPFGSGAGSFVSVFEMNEPRALLTPLYINHAHNDYLEMLLEFGLAAPILIGAGFIVLARDAWRVWRNDGTRAAVAIGRASSIALGQFAFGSLFDYPLRTPLLAAIAVVLVTFLRAGALDTGRGPVTRSSTPSAH